MGSLRDPDGEMAAMTEGAGDRALVRRGGPRRRRRRLGMRSVAPSVLYGAGLVSDPRYGDRGC